MTEWKWLPDGKSVEITGPGATVQVFVVASATDRELRDFQEKIAREAQVFKILKNARVAFESGLAYYRDARENLSALIQERAESLSILCGIAKDISVFFTPEKLADSFSNDPEGLCEFAIGFMTRAWIGTRE